MLKYIMHWIYEIDLDGNLLVMRFKSGIYVIEITIFGYDLFVHNEFSCHVGLTTSFRNQLMDGEIPEPDMEDICPKLDKIVEHYRRIRKI